MMGKLLGRASVTKPKQQGYAAQQKGLLLSDSKCGIGAFLHILLLLALLSQESVQKTAGKAFWNQ